MGNPHPTKSKPCKIGRKHTGADSSRQRGKHASGACQAKDIRAAKYEIYHRQVAEYYAGLREEYPKEPRM